ncbi:MULTISPECIES: retron St85 family RNA-directed DNA polymerase [Vibrio]|uniref:retron St85 family RNA-directed DNA polymerase n=1 Tax=Vibrio TaxID=662 RepID=UPI000C85611D|nr:MULTISPECIES: retron St85 family RNA-directed DNA polymerase [Vibrio]MCC4782118.1 retron St85 family RNA-directed DNA polymerase [Vibrio lentus]PMJ03752.1 hypothetical protein BCU31_15155 [Vibrio lentus]RPF12748.1 reverse transcriptase (RNA-dependent DNA polymerase) [Vibrio crassostreae]TKG15429.1 RNA-directed DNA polymerase [Vibrio lentus]
MNISTLLSEHLFLDDIELRSFADSAPYRYKVYKIPKRNSEELRTIAHPSKELKFVQRLIAKELSSVLPLHQASMAYRKGTSIRDNALVHSNSSYLLKMDLKDFFPSIKPELFFRECSRYGLEWTDLDKTLLNGFLFWKPRRAKKLVLSIGAPSSPLVSNFVLYQFDEHIANYCKELGVNYTRYADDMTFSTDRKDLLFKFPIQVRKTLKALYGSSIKVNLNKTVFSSKAHNRHVTGVTLSNEGKVTIGRERKRVLSASIHHFSLGVLGHDEILKLKGHFAHLIFIEPLVKEQMIKKYGSSLIGRLTSYQGSP